MPKKNPFMPPQGRFLADDTPMLGGSPAAALGELKATLAGTTVVVPPRRPRAPQATAPKGLPSGPAAAPYPDWERQRPLEAPAQAAPQVPFARTWDRQRGRLSGLPSRTGPAGRPLYLLRARQLF